MDKTENRRRFFRIVDLVDLNYRIIDEQQASKPSYTTNQILGACSLTSALESVTQESAKLLHRVEKKQPELVHYLKLLDEKIDLLAQAILGEDQGEKNNRRELSLSASGLAFQSAEALNPGVFLEFKMMLSSFRILLVACGKVVQCRKKQSADGEPFFLISADFVGLTEQDQDTLMQHLVRRQMQQIREKSSKH